nr:hypothetical protein [Tanacetum cinerariifolium]
RRYTILPTLQGSKVIKDILSRCSFYSGKLKCRRSIKFRGGLLGIKSTRHSHCQERVPVGNKMHKAFPLLEESSHWQYNFPLPVEGVPIARGMEIPLPRVRTAMIKKLPVKENWQLH